MNSLISAVTLIDRSPSLLHVSCSLFLVRTTSKCFEYEDVIRFLACLGGSLFAAPAF
jgi:hypothetical protein